MPIAFAKILKKFSVKLLHEIAHVVKRLSVIHSQCVHRLYGQVVAVAETPENLVHLVHIVCIVLIVVAPQQVKFFYRNPRSCTGIAISGANSEERLDFSDDLFAGL